MYGCFLAVYAVKVGGNIKRGNGNFGAGGSILGRKRLLHTLLLIAMYIQMST